MGNSQQKQKKEKLHRKEDKEIIEEIVEELKKPGRNEHPVDLDKNEAGIKVKLNVAADYINKYLKFALGDGSQVDVGKKVFNFGKVVTFLEGEYILRAGEDCQGLFVILDGSVDILVTDNTLTIGSLSTGDIFGEISTIFGIKCTANIKVKSDVSAVVIEPEKAFELFEANADSLDILDWCVKNRYFPLGKEIDMTRTYRRTTLHFLKQVPAFANWKEAHVKNMILSIKRGLVTLYPPKATIISEDEDIRSVFVVIRGTVRLNSSGGYYKDIEVSRYSSHFIYGNFCMSIETHKSYVTIQAVTNCQVIEIDICSIYVAANRDEIPSLQDGPRRFECFKKRLPHIRKEFPGYFEYDVLYHYLKTSDLYKDTSVEDIENKVLNSLCEEYKDDSIVVLAMEKEKYEAVLVLCGTLLLQQTIKLDGLKDGIIENGKNEETDSNTEKNAESESKRTATCNTNKKIVVFNEGSIIDMFHLDLNQVSLKSKGQSFVCKIPKSATDTFAVSSHNVMKKELSKEELADISNGENKLNIKDEDEKENIIDRTQTQITKLNDRNSVTKEPESENMNETETSDTDKQMNEQSAERQEGVLEAASKDDKPVSNENCVSKINVEELKLRQSGDALTKLNERIRKGDKIGKPAEKAGKKQVKKHKKTNALEFV